MKIEEECSNCNDGIVRTHTLEDDGSLICLKCGCDEMKIEEVKK